MSISHLLALLLLVGVISPALADDKPGGPPAPVTVAEVIEKTTVSHARISGTVQPLRETVVAARVAGIVATVHVEVGDTLAAGTLLVTLDSKEAIHNRKIRQAAWLEAQAKLKQAKNDLARDRQLLATNAVSRKKLADRATEVTIQAARLQAATAHLALAQEQLSWHRVTAPFAGVVTQRLAQPGQWLELGGAVVRLIDPNRLELEAMVPGALASRLPPGTQVEAESDQGQAPITATLRAVVPRDDPVSRNRPTFWTLTHQAGVVAGREITLRIPNGPAETLLLAPKDAVVRSQGNVLMYVVEKGVVLAMPVRLGTAVGDRFQILEGLRAGQKVVIRGNERLHPGQRVQVIPMDKESP